MAPLSLASEANSLYKSGMKNWEKWNWFNLIQKVDFQMIFKLFIE